MNSKPAIRKSRSKKRRKIKPVNKVLNHCISILSMLIEDNKGKNEIFRQLQKLKESGLNYKFDTLDAIYHLKEGCLIKSIETINHLQKEEMELTELGREIALLKDSIEQHMSSYSNLLKTIGENFSEVYTSDIMLKSKLQSKNWQKNEIWRYEAYVREAQSFGLKSLYTFINALLFRYLFLLFKIEDNEVAKNILNTIFATALNQHFSGNFRGFINTILSMSMYETIRSQEEIINSMIGHFKRPVLDYISHFTGYEPLIPLNNRFVKKEAHEVINSIYDIIEPTGEKDLLKSLISSIKYEPPK